MIQYLQMTNFMSHRSTRLDFHPGVNAFRGLSDAGKSAAFKAIYWLTFNRPLGDEFISHWADGTEVEIGLDDGVAVGRVKGKGTNYYYIDQRGKREELKAPGNGPPPDPVAKLLNMDQLNFQTQFGGFFLLGESAAEVARFFNRVVDLDVIDRTLASINARVREEGRKRELAGQLAAKDESDLVRFVWLNDAEADLRTLEGIESNLKKLKQDRSDLTRQQSDLARMELELDESGKVVATMSRRVIGLEKEQREIAELDRQSAGLASQLDSLTRMQGELVRVQGVELFGDKVAEMEVLKIEIDHITTRYDSAFDLYEQLRERERELVVAKSNLAILLAEYKRLMPDECPVCGTPKAEWRK